ncbi:MAG: PPC domain-containing protein, partial [Verrucomicrobiales bacterium]
MNRLSWLFMLGLAGLAAMAPRAQGQASPYIGFVYPAGGQRGITTLIELGGQRLDGVHDAIVSGEGVQAKLVDYHPKLSNQEMTLLRDQLKKLKPKKGEDPPQDWATRKIIANLEKRIEGWVNRPACSSLSDLAFVEVTMAPDAKPGARDIRLVTQSGVSNPLVFHVGQLPEFTRKAMKTSTYQVLGKEELALRKRPPEEAENGVELPCIINGQVASGEVNRYRFEVHKGQRLVISVNARELIPYIADAVPGWFQPVIALFDADGKEVAFNDDYRFNPDPTIYYETPKDGEYVLAISDAIYRGREDFIYRITVSERPFVTSTFPLGGQAGRLTKVAMRGWNLRRANLILPPESAKKGVYLITAEIGKPVSQQTGANFVSNQTPFALGTLPESFDKEPNNDLAHAQRVRPPIIINGHINRPDDWDVFKVGRRAREAIVVEVQARRLDSPVDSFLKLTDAAGKVVAFNDDWDDLESGVNTHHADSHLMVKVPATGDYYIHLGDTARNGGVGYAYRLRISDP